MGLFSRKTSTDPHLPELTTKQADKLRALSVSALHRQGITVTDAGDHLDAGNEQLYGLFAVARKATALPDKEWAAMVEQHFAAGINNTPATQVSTEELLARVYPKFIAPETMDWMESQHGPSIYSYARPTARLPLLMALDSPESVTYITADQAEAAGGADLLWDKALSNLIADGPGHPEEFTAEGGSFLIFETETVYQASWISCMDKFVELLGYKPGPLGALVTIPATNMLCLHLVTESTSINDFSAMLMFAGNVHTQHPSPLTPLLYWWNGTTVEPISGTDGEDVNLYLPDELLNVLQS
ncbi:hypothetical protein [Paenarthrobacter nicotinovorans]|nr:hypothetical protein [Paenarthrobacter nicotinovorans]